MKSMDCNGTRSNVAGQATGSVLEIGFGSGYNILFYGKIDKLYALEPSIELYNLAKDRVSAASFPVEYISNSAENIPLPDHSIDTVVSTWVFCSIPDAIKALKEIGRVLKPAGRFVFVEHGRTTHGFFSKLQDLLTPLMRLINGNCHLNRKIDDLIAKAGFEFVTLEKFPEAGRPLMFSYRGVAIKKQH